MGWFCGSNGPFQGQGRWAASEAEPTELSDRGFMAIILDLLAEKPGTGLDVVQALESRLEDLFVVSPGSVYPVLQLLDDAGLVVASAVEGRKTYAVTPAGEAYRAERREPLDSFWARVERRRLRADVVAIFHEARGLVWQLHDGDAVRGLERDHLAKIREALAGVRSAIARDQAG